MMQETVRENTILQSARNAICEVDKQIINTILQLLKTLKKRTLPSTYEEKKLEN